jgi:hypothetical protein
MIEASASVRDWVNSIGEYEWETLWDSVEDM